MQNNDSENPAIKSRELTRFGRMSILAFHAAQIGIPIVGLLTLLADDSWIADLFANLRLQLIIAGVIGAVAACAAFRWKSAAVQLAILGLHFCWLLMPPDRAEQTTSAADLTVTAVNVLIHNLEHSKIADALQEISADVIAVTELSPDLCDLLTNRLADSHPHVAAEPHLGAFGVAIFSKHPLSDVELLGTVSTGTSLLATVHQDDQSYRIAAVHPFSPMTPNTFRIRNEHLALVSSAVESNHQDHPEDPFIAIGDFNLTPWSPHFRAFQQSTELRHVAEGWGIEPTWYAREQKTFPFGLALDHCMVSPELKYVSHELGPFVSSDHLPLTVQLSLK